MMQYFSLAGDGRSAIVTGNYHCRIDKALDMTDIRDTAHVPFPVLRADGAVLPAHLPTCLLLLP